MVRIKRGELGSERGWEVSNPAIRIFVPEDYGPRILELSLEGGPNLLAELPEARLTVAGYPPYFLRGGHRLWAAPEQPEMTYAPDDQAPEIVLQEGGLDIFQAADRAGIQKSWQVRLDQEGAELTIQHRLTNTGHKSLEVAPWAVTMFPPGGVALLPLSTGQDNPSDLKPNRQLIIWPYTDLNSPSLEITNLSIIVHANLSQGKLKIGAPNRSGWIAYRQKGVLFVKRTIYQEGKEYPDRGASHQIYCDPGTIELESLGPLVKLEPMDSTVHVETWQLFKDGSWPAEIRDLGGL